MAARSSPPCGAWHPGALDRAAPRTCYVNPADVVAVVLCAAAGYAVGTLPVSAWVARAAGVDLNRDVRRNPGSATVWRLAGPGPGLLAVSADLAKGVLPVALATVTSSPVAGLAAGLGALAGAVWPVLGRIPAGGAAGAIAVLVGAAFALAPPAGILAALLALAAVGVSRLARRT